MPLLNNLSTAISTNNDKEILNSLKVILENGADIKLTDNKLILTLLNNKSESVTAQTVQVIAEWAKTEHNRTLLTDADIINSLTALINNKNQDIVINTIRALGNICYENEKACDIIEKSGIDCVLNVLKNDHQRDDSTLTTKASGFLLNLLSTSEQLPRIALKNGILNILETLLTKYKKSFNDHQTAITFLVAILNTVETYFNEQNIVLSESMCYLLVEIFRMSPSPEISVTVIEILHGQTERDNIKTILAKEGFCEVLYDLIEKYRCRVTDEESRSVLKMACDLIVLVLTGDDCMYLLYNNGKGKVYEDMVKWLDSDDPDLLSTGVLALGNFARKDTHCIQMVKSGISKKLIGILSKHNSVTSDIKIQHALLSTLKNLVIPPQNKAQVLQEGLIDVIYPLVKSDQYLVVFKLLGTFRMVIDGQETTALDLIARKEFLDRLLYWCYNSDHIGVRGEVPRLLAWLIKNCHTSKPYKSILYANDSIKCLIEMISSNYNVMQNEALVSLNLLCTEINKCGGKNDDENNKSIIKNCDYTNDDVVKLYQDFVNAEVGKNLYFAVNRYGEKMDKQTIDSLLTFLEHLIKEKLIVEQLNKAGVGGVLDKLLANNNVCGLERIEVIRNEINKT